MNGAERVVVDASALAAMTFGEPAGALIAERLEGVVLASPSLLAYEMPSVAHRKLAEHPGQRAALLDVLADFERLPIELYEPAPARLVTVA